MQRTIICSKDHRDLWTTKEQQLYYSQKKQKSAAEQKSERRWGEEEKDFMKANLTFRDTPFVGHTPTPR